MKKRVEQGLTELANAAFKKVAQKVIKLAENSGTPVIVYVKGEVKAVRPQLLGNGRKQASRSKVHHLRKASK
ncbi:MAG TPA: hypothetical protein VMF69_03295 [Gemmataceae bacterium]|nr:hypothetical protein [Gemmataceae bacterium]